MDSLQRLWRGELPLPDAFWTWAVLGGLVVNIVSSVGFLALISADQALAAVIVGYALSIPYNVVAAVGVWRSADRFEGERKWADLAKVVTIVGMGLLSVT